MSGIELNGKSAQSAHNEPATPSQIGWIHGKPQVREARQQRCQGDPALQPGQRCPQAVVDAMSVPEVLIVTPCKI